MGKIIYIFGASGSGTTTLVKKICDKHGFFHADTDNYAWLPTAIRCSTRRDIPERKHQLQKDIADNDVSVVTGCVCSWGAPFLKFDLAVLLDVPTEVRLKRIEQRRKNDYGDRILPDGDMYFNHLEFLQFVTDYDTAGEEITRTRVLHETWLNKVLTCPILRIVGAVPSEQSFSMVEEKMQSLGIIEEKPNTNPRTNENECKYI